MDADPSHVAGAPAGGGAAKDADAWARVFAGARPRARRRPIVALWLEELATAGTLRSAAGGDPDHGRTLLAGALDVLDRLPARSLPRDDLAASCCGDRHALDDGRPLATLVLPAAALLGGVPPGSGARWRREAWASVGVLPGDPGAPVTTLGLAEPPGLADSPGRAGSPGGDGPVPVTLGLDDLLGGRPLARPRGVVSVCRSGAVLEAAAAAGCRAPLVCTGGQPDAAACTLLRRLAAAGAAFRVHADFDWAGVTASNAVVRRVGAAPWRMGTADYDAVARAGGEPLRGAPVAASWDAALAPAMQRRRVRVGEERVLPTLLADLRAPARDHR